MNRADRLHAVLRDGRKRTRREIFEEAGCFFMTNNAAAELRARGVDVVHTREGANDCYQLRETCPTAAGPVSRSGSQSPSHTGTDSPDAPTTEDYGGPLLSTPKCGATLSPEVVAPPLFETEAA